FTVDDNALYKHPDVEAMRDPEAYPREERAAREKGVTYVKLDGEVGILGNGAGLVMSTLDVIALAGGRPANFCDLGGGGDAQGVTDALEIISADSQVRSILFNIFAGITRCDEVARGILQALDRTKIAHPIVVRFDVATGGGHVANALRGAGLDVVTIDRAPGMKPDVVSRAEEIPFADESFDVVACRVAAHHFQDPSAALKEMARVSRSLVLVADNL